ncbi:ADP-ribose pyrophosphatase YjhB, NUDIX family [Thermosyntropha lipolytica DSM 11003]|uniref:ADP-ribose pyrophosphatase YjhB, NUDIX family n=1 Tax=Thermosyntropha lipolytica DSM 11003 TaxID=1123382 RepID=A0A1M5PT11_9FIRM|nr:NUDIX hydrolase [Thermosyntropha lipolytica]SHH05087.1 ADP-ribose pyrophosphatase YjhB, NUDIX family [Thermosyntropha lipolytica DSM 11003]
MDKYRYCPLCASPLMWGMRYGRRRQYCPSCQFINYENPLPTTVALAETNRQILLIKRGIEPLKGIWTLPSGFVETGETPEQACLRELKEETNMDGVIKELIGVFHSLTPMYGDIISIVYYIKLSPGIPKAGDDAEGVALVNIEEIDDLGFKSFNQAFSIFKQKYFS